MKKNIHALPQWVQKTSVTLCFLLLLPLHFYAQTVAQHLDSLIGTYASRNNFSGSILVAEKGEIIFQKAYGWAHMERREPMKITSDFNLASVSKQFFAMGIMMLKERGKLRYEDDFTKYIPELSFYKGITIRNLLNHTGGLADYMELFEKYWDTTKTATNKDVIDLFIKYKPEILFRPGDNWEYSNTGYVLLASIIERASGEEMHSFIQKNIFEPLEMKNSLVYSKVINQPIPEKTCGYAYLPKEKKFIPDDVNYLDGVAGDGAIYSNTGDLFKWDRALYTEKLVKKETLAEAFMPAKLNNDSIFPYGFAWMIVTEANGKSDFSKHPASDLPKYKNSSNILLHSGSWIGYRNIFFRDMQNQHTIIILNNTSDRTTRQILPEQIFNVLYQRPFTVPQPKNTKEE